MAGRPLFEDRRARLLPADRYRVVCPLAAARDWSIDGVAVLDATFAEYPAFPSLHRGDRGGERRARPKEQHCCASRRRPVTVPLGALPLLDAEVGWGHLGAGGSLGYDGSGVRVGGEHRTDALSSHPPGCLRYHLRGSARRFRARDAPSTTCRKAPTHSAT